MPRLDFRVHVRRPGGVLVGNRVDIGSVTGCFEHENSRNVPSPEIFSIFILESEGDRADGQAIVSG